MIDPKHLQYAQDAINRVAKSSKKLYMAFYNGRLLDVGKIGYTRRGDLILSLSKTFMSNVYTDLSRATADLSRATAGYKSENWRIAQGKCKEVIEEMIKDNIIEIKHI